MYCSNCGKLIDDDNKYCPHCGAQNKNATSSYGYGSSGSTYETPNNTPWGYRPQTFSSIHADEGRPEDQTLGVLAIVFSALGGVLGLILALVGLSKYKEEPGRKKCKTALILLAIWVVILILIYLSAGSGSYY